MKVIVLDRDGVINQDSDAFIKTPDEWIPIPGSLEAIALLTSAGYKIFIATNQSGIARGYFSHKVLEDIHNKMRKAISSLGGHVEKIVYCPHGPDDNCACRKPKPGMLTTLFPKEAERTNIPMIGDAARDLQAAKAASMIPYLVLTGKGAKTLAEHPNIVSQDNIFNDLFCYAQSLLK